MALLQGVLCPRPIIASSIERTFLTYDKGRIAWFASELRITVLIVEPVGNRRERCHVLPLIVVSLRNKDWFASNNLAFK